jgi:hypothetical protein
MLYRCALLFCAVCVLVFSSCNSLAESLRANGSVLGELLSCVAMLASLAAGLGATRGAGCQGSYLCLAIVGPVAVCTLCWGLLSLGCLVAPVDSNDGRNVGPWLWALGPASLVLTVLLSSLVSARVCP